MKISKEEVQRWIDALYSGDYKQGFGGQLQDDAGFCCLGVACDLFIPKDDQDIDIYEASSKPILTGDLPDQQKFAPAWLKHINQDFEDICGVKLSVLNDHAGYGELTVNSYSERFTFDEIAGLLQLVYIEEALAAPKVTKAEVLKLLGALRVFPAYGDLVKRIEADGLEGDA